MTICKDHAYPAGTALAAGTPVKIDAGELVAVNALTDDPFGVVLESVAAGEIPKIPIDGEQFDLSHAALTVAPGALLGGTTSAAWADISDTNITTIDNDAPIYGLVTVERPLTTTSSRVRASRVVIFGTATP